MAFVLIGLLFIVSIAVDYFVFSRRYPQLGAAWPGGVFLQPTSTWGSIGPSGNLYLGVHPMLLRLVGAPCELECRQPGEHVAKGDTLVTIGRAGRHLSVRSPVAARVDRVNRQAVAEVRSREVNGPDGVWLYRLHPDQAAETTTWLTGAAAAEWTRRRYDELRSFLQGTVAENHLGVMMADGGDLPIGILGEMDQEVWNHLEQRFLSVGTEAQR